jgi:enoyl-CoA hydratase/carnithine racemase
LSEVQCTITDDHVAVVTLARPPDNRIDPALVGALASVLEELDEDGRCRAVVLRADGEHFCAGATLRPSTEPVFDSAGPHLYDEAIRLFATRKPIVAAVKGAAIGGGLGLALAADFRVGGASTRLSANFARLGFHQGFGLSVTLPAAVGQQAALDLLLTGRRISGQTGLELGLLDLVVPDANLDSAAQGWAEEIAASAPLAVQSIRATMRGDLLDRVRNALAHERAEQQRLRESEDFVEGVAAYAERRPANFRGR